jgi:outer membrane murein-binding lipoprotein Lpp
MSRFDKIEKLDNVDKTLSKCLAAICEKIQNSALDRALDVLITFKGNIDVSGVFSNSDVRPLTRGLIMMKALQPLLNNTSSIEALRASTPPTNNLTIENDIALPLGTGSRYDFFSFNSFNRKHDPQIRSSFKSAAIDFKQKYDSWNKKFDLDGGNDGRAQTAQNSLGVKDLNRDVASLRQDVDAIKQDIATIKRDVFQLRTDTDAILGKYTLLHQLFAELKANVDEKMLSFTAVQTQFAGQLATHNQSILQVQKDQRAFEKKTTKAITDISRSLQQGFAQSTSRLAAIDKRVKSISSEQFIQAVKHRQLERSQAQSDARVAAIDTRVEGLSNDVDRQATESARQGQLLQSLASSVDASKATLDEMAKSVQAANKRIASLESLINKLEKDFGEHNSANESRFRAIQGAQEELKRRYAELAAVSVEALAGVYILASINRVQNTFLSRAIAAANNFVNIADGLDAGKSAFERSFAEWQSEFTGVFSCVNGILDLASTVPFFGEIPKLAKKILNKTLGAGTLTRFGRDASGTDVSVITGDETGENLRAGLDSAANYTVTAFLNEVGGSTDGGVTDAATEQLSRLAGTLSPLKKATVAVLGRVVSGNPAFTIGLERIQTDTTYKETFSNLRDQLLNQSLSVIAEASSILGDKDSVRIMVSEAMLEGNDQKLVAVADKISETFLEAWAPLIQGIEDAGRQVSIISPGLCGDFWYFRFICAFGALHGEGHMIWSELHYRRSTPLQVLEYFSGQGLAVEKQQRHSAEIYQAGQIPITNKSRWSTVKRYLTDDDRNHKVVLAITLAKIDMWLREDNEEVWQRMLRGVVPNWKREFRSTVKFIGSLLDPTKGRCLERLRTRKDIDHDAATELYRQVRENQI